jgi:hypothetical protein
MAACPAHALVELRCVVNSWPHQEHMQGRQQLRRPHVSSVDGFQG